MSGLGAASIYDLLQFVAPMFVALLFAAGEEPLLQAFKRVSTVILAIATAVGVYGIIQYTVLPPWDAAWLQHAAIVQGMVTNGLARPLEVRVFSVLNSSEPCASFLAVAVALNLYRLNDGRIFPMVGMLVCAITLLLTLERSAWVGLAAAVIVYALLSRKPLRAVSVGLACGAIVAALFLFLSPSLAAQTGDAQSGKNSIALRFETFMHLGTDVSANARVVETAGLVSAAIAYPTGEGLGIIGTSAQLASFAGAINAIDGGLQARLAEMGFAGAAGYCVVLLLTFGVAIERWREARKSGNDAESDLFASLLAVQTVLIVLDFSIDSHVGLPGVLFWMTVGMTLSRGKALATETASLGFQPAAC